MAESVEQHENTSKPSKTVGEILLSADWRVVFGLAFAQAWMTVRWFCLSGLPLGPNDAASGLMSSSCLVATISLLLCALFEVKVDKTALTPRWTLAVGLLSVASSAFIPLHGVMGGASDAWAMVGGIASGMGSSLLFLTWFAVCVRVRNVIDLSLGFLLSAALVFLLAAAEPLLPEGPLFDVAFSVAPVACSVALLLAVVLGAQEEGRKAAGEPAEVAAGAGGPKDRAHTGDERTPAATNAEQGEQVLRFFAKTCMGALLVGLANEMLRMGGSQGPVLFSGGGSFYWVSAVVLAAVNLGIARQVASGKPSSFYFVCRGAMVLSIAGALLYPYAAGAEGLVMAVSTAGRQCVQILVWIVVFQLCLKYRQSVAKLFGGMCGVWYLGSFLGMLVYRLGGSALSDGGPFPVEVASVAAVLLLVVAFGLVFSEKDSALVFEKPASPQWRAKAFTRACDFLVEKGRLTKREADVLRLLAKGASVSHIEERLYISSSTVSTHMKHIYQKLGVHSRSELFDLVESTTKRFAQGDGNDEA